MSVNIVPGIKVQWQCGKGAYSQWNKIKEKKYYICCEDYAMMWAIETQSATDM